MALCAAIAGIQAGGHTQLHDGWFDGAQALADGPADAGPTGLRRVILLSDGCAHEGLTETAAITRIRQVGLMIAVRQASPLAPDALRISLG